MSKLIEYTCELNINNNSNLKKYIEENDSDILIGLLKHMRNLVCEDWSEILIYSPFSFVPSNDLTGAGGCSVLDCKLNRAINYAKFASLYCDTSYLRLDLLSNLHEIDIVAEEDIEDFKRNLLSDLSLINLYSPLIYDGIIKVIPSSLGVCTDCFERAIEKIIVENDINKLDVLIEKLNKKCTIVIDGYFKHPHSVGVTIKNLPEIFPEHDGSMFIHKGHILTYLNALKQPPTILRNKKCSMEIIKNLVLEQFNNVILETGISKSYKSKYITSQQVNSYITDIMIGNDFKHEQIKPIYNMPIIDNASIDNILKVRKSEQEAFENYRVALNNAIKEHYVNQSNTEIQEIYDDIVYPSFVKLENNLKRISQKNIIKSLGDIAIVGTTITIGTMSGIIQADPTTIFTALSGASVISALGNKSIDRLVETNNTKENDYYFLWKLKKNEKRSKSHKNKRKH